MLQMGSKQLVFSALKEAESGDGIILRVYNTSNDEIADTIHCTRGVRSAWTTKLNEQQTDQLTVIDSHDIPVRVPPSGVMSVKVQLM